MISTDDALWPLLDRYLAGECTAAEAASVRDWLVVAPQEHEMLFADVQHIRNVIKRRAPVRSPENTWPLVAHELGLISSSNQLSLTNRTTQPRVPTQEQSQTRARRGGIFKPYTLRRGVFKSQTLRAWYIATGLALSVLGIAIAWYGHPHQGTLPMSGAVSTYATTSGERANITLPDGTKVTLDVASRLDVPTDYATGHHTVHLSGEALFTVTRHDGLPFTVIAGSTMARVLGTSFAVRRYPTDTTALVVVQEGKVGVGDLVVTASQFVEVGPRHVVRRGSADATQFGFATGVLTLPTMPLAQAAVELDRWYAADIRFGDASLARVPIGGQMTAGSLSDLENVLELMLNVRVVRDGRVLTLYPRTR